jgi:predicted nucleic acid-binding protein
MIVVADASPLNYLVLIGHSEILPYFYQRVLVPPSVWEELHDANTPAMVKAWVALAPAWLERHPLNCPPDASLNFLDPGEREAIALALELGANRLIADETLAREEAKRRNVSVIGTLGVLRNAARSASVMAVISSVAHLRLCRASPSVAHLLSRISCRASPVAHLPQPFIAV